MKDSDRVRAEYEKKLSDVEYLIARVEAVTGRKVTLVLSAPEPEPEPEPASAPASDSFTSDEVTNVIDEREDAAADAKPDDEVEIEVPEPEVPTVPDSSTSTPSTRASRSRRRS